MQGRHPLAQLLQRQQLLLIGGQHALDAFADTDEIALQRLLALPCRVSGASDGEAAIQFLLNQRGILEQSHDLGPHDRIQEILSHRSAVAAGPAEMAPRIRADAAILVNHARARPRRRARERVPAPMTAHQTLHETWGDGPPPRPHFVHLQQFVRTGKGRLVDEGGYGDFDPFLTWSFVIGAVARRDAAAQAKPSRHTLTCGDARFAEAGGADIRGVAQHRPHRRALPSGPRLPCRHPLVIEPTRDRADAPTRHDVVAIHLSYHPRFALDDGIRCRGVIALPNVAVTVRRAAQDADFARSRPVTLAASRPLEDLGPLVLGDHSLKLHEQLILGRGALRRIQKARLDTVTGEFFDQQDLIGVLTTQSIGAVNEDGLNLPFGCQIAHALKAGPLERGAAIALIFEDPGLGHFDVERPRQLDQCRGLARNRVGLALLLRGDARVNRRHLHADAPLPPPRPGDLGSGRESHTRGPVCWPVTDRMRSRAERAGRRDADIAHPRRKGPRNAASARVTICPRVSPLRRAYARRARTMLTGSLNVMATVGSTAGTEALMAAACSR